MLLTAEAEYIGEGGHVFGGGDIGLGNIKTRLEERVLDAIDCEIREVFNSDGLGNN